MIIDIEWTNIFNYIYNDETGYIVNCKVAI